jgi:hypothetical protein
MRSITSRKGPAGAPARKIIDACALKEIARLAKIDATKPDVCNGFFVNLRAAINDAWSAPSEPSKAVYQAQVLEILSSWQEAIATIKTLSNPDPSSVAAVHALGHIRAFLSHERTGALDQFEDSWRSSVDDLEGAVTKATGLVQQKYRKSGHPPGGLGAGGLSNVGANIFVASLIYAVEASGGHLKKSRKGNELRGPLVDAIDLLRPHLPASLLPPATSVRFYEVIAAEVARELERHWD